MPYLHRSTRRNGPLFSMYHIVIRETARDREDSIFSMPKSERKGNTLLLLGRPCGTRPQAPNKQVFSRGVRVGLNYRQGSTHVGVGGRDLATAHGRTPKRPRTEVRWADNSRACTCDPGDCPRCDRDITFVVELFLEQRRNVSLVPLAKNVGVPSTSF